MAMTIGEFGLDGLQEEYGDDPGFFIWFYLFTFLMSLILINVFIAIVSEGFMKAKEEASEKTITPMDSLLMCITPFGVSNAAKCLEAEFKEIAPPKGDGGGGGGDGEEGEGGGVTELFKSPRDVKKALSRMMIGPCGRWVVMNSGTLASCRRDAEGKEEEEEDGSDRATGDDVRRVEAKVAALEAKLDQLLSLAKK